MNIRIILFCIIILFFYNNCYSQNSKDTVIYWSKYQKLKWADFQSKTIVNLMTNVGINASAVTAASSIYKIHETNDSIICKVYCVFYKTLSWVKDTAIGILKHEQLHFDIEELFTRKIKKVFDSLRIANVLDVHMYVQKAEALESDCEKVQDLYDNETKHGSVPFNQKAWENRIATELNKLKKYDLMNTISMEK